MGRKQRLMQRRILAALREKAVKAERFLSRLHRRRYLNFTRQSWPIQSSVFITAEDWDEVKGRILARSGPMVLAYGLPAYRRDPTTHYLEFNPAWRREDCDSDLLPLLELTKSTRKARHVVARSTAREEEYNRCLIFVRSYLVRNGIDFDWIPRSWESEGLPVLEIYRPAELVRSGKVAAYNVPKLAAIFTQRAVEGKPNPTSEELVDWLADTRGEKALIITWDRNKDYLASWDTWGSR